jgi:hypothetical protein
MTRLLGALRMVALAAWPLLDPVFAHADVVLDWNVVALRTTAAAPFNPPLESRNMAIVHAAMFDAVNSIEHEFEPFAVRLHAPEGASPDAAAAAAAHLVLVQLYPDQRTVLDAAYAGSLALISDGASKTDGIAVGEAVASRILTARASDGAAAAIAAEYTPGTGPGVWIPTPPAFLRALDPGWGGVRPFLMENAAQFRPGPPPALSSGQYTRDFDEVKEAGSSTSAIRTQEKPIWRASGSPRGRRTGIRPRGRRPSRKA